MQKSRSAPDNFGDAPPLPYAASLDGDADRIVFFACGDGAAPSAGANAPVARLLDGDKTASLVAAHIAGLAAAAGLRLRLGVVQTAYANGAAAAFLRTLGPSSSNGNGDAASASASVEPASSALCSVDVEVVPTGVKHLHAAAERYDVGIYWESNGHGAALFSDAALARIHAAAAAPGATAAASAAAQQLAALAAACNPSVGDALSGLLLVEGVLSAKGWTLSEWDALYCDRPSRQRVVKVADRAALRTAPGNEQRCVAPAGLQGAIEAAVAAAGAGARAFARASGTEDVVRVYAEAATQAAADALAQAVGGAVHAHAGGLGAWPPMA